jgi:hypothetical protein
MGSISRRLIAAQEGDHPFRDLGVIVEIVVGRAIEDQ